MRVSKNWVKFNKMFTLSPCTLPPKHIKTESKLFEPGSAEAQLELKKDMGY